MRRDCDGVRRGCDADVATLPHLRIRKCGPHVRTALSARYVAAIFVRTARADVRIADSALDGALA